VRVETRKLNVNSRYAILSAALAGVLAMSATASAQGSGDVIEALQARSTAVFEKADPWVVGIRVRVHVPYTVQISPDGRIEWYARTGSFRITDASEAGMVVVPNRGEVSPGVAELPGGTRTRTWADRYGTGFLLDTGGNIVTTYHLVRDATPGTEMYIVSGAGVESPATLVGTDPYTNIAVVRTTSGWSAASTAESGSSDTRDTSRRRCRWRRGATGRRS